MSTDPPAPAAVAAPRVLGRLQEFDPRVDNMSTYLERLELYFDANAVEAARKVPVLLTVIGARAYDTLRSLLAPTKPQDKSFTELLAILKEHFDPKPLVIGERFQFYKRSQKPGETVAEFQADLRKLSIRCEFGTFLDQAIRDRFVCGVKSETIQKKLLAEDGLTAARALELAQSIEAAEKNARQLKGESLATGDSILSTGAEKGTTCYRCGRCHDERTCKYKDATCHKCGKPGHIAPVCRSSSRKPHTTGPPPDNRSKGQGKRGVNRKPKSRSGGARWLGTGSGSSDDLGTYSVHDPATPQPPILVDLTVSGKVVTFEVDTGATVTIISEVVFNKLFPSLQLKPSNLALRTYTGEAMRVLGEAPVLVSYQNQESQRLSLVVIKGAGPILLGRNWLKHFRLDWQDIKSVHSHQVSQLTALLDKYSEVFTEELGTIKPFQAKLVVDPKATPRFHRPRPVPYALKKAVEEELDRLERAGVLEKVDHSDWAAPIVVVPKKDGHVRLCGDYSVTVNPALDVDQYPLPRPTDLFATLAGGKYFTKLDLSHAYNQIELAEESRKYLTINTHKGLYRYTRLPFGVASAPALFQKTMDIILAGIEGVICYIDDIMVTGKTEEEHLERLNQVLQRLQEHGIRVKLSKCTFMRTSVDYLGHRVDAEGLHATDDKMQAIVDAPVPKNISELRSFLGLLNYYGRFIPNLSSLLHPLNSLLRQDVPWKWSKECNQAFQAAKDKIVAPNVLVHYDPNLPIRLAGDASSYGIGAVISHVMPGGEERPIAFASRTLLPSERNYSQIEREALSLIFGVSKFHTYLYGRKFVLVTDHKPLTTIFGHKKGIPPMTAARLQRWALKLSAYSYEIEFRCTNEHSNADCLSRLPVNSADVTGHTPEPGIFNISQIESLPVTAVQLAKATRTDPILSAVYQHITKGWPSHISQNLSTFVAKKEELTVEGGCVLWGTRVVIPTKWREKLLQELHHEHPGVCKMKGIARSYFWWPGLDHSIEELVKSCPECQAVKKSPSTAPLHPWAWPSHVFQRIHVDFLGPFQGSMFLVAVDAYSKWPEVFIMPTTTTGKTIDCLRSLFCRYGYPEQLVSDNGPQFISEEFAIFMRSCGVKHLRSAPYHPATNGLAERFVQSLKQSLKASQNSGRPLPQRLCDFLLMYRSAVHSTTGVSPNSLFLKREVRTRLDLLRPDSHIRVQDKQALQKANHDLHSKDRSFAVGDPVFVKNFRTGPDWVAAIVVAKLGPLSYLVETLDKQLWRRHVDHVKSRATTTPPDTVPDREEVPDPDELELEQADPGGHTSEPVMEQLEEPEVSPQPTEPAIAADTSATTVESGATPTSTTTPTVTPPRQDPPRTPPPTPPLPEKRYELRQGYRMPAGHWRGTCKTIYV